MQERNESAHCYPGWEAFVEEKQPVAGSLPSQQPHDSPRLNNLWGPQPLAVGDRLSERAELLLRGWRGGGSEVASSPCGPVEGYKGDRSELVWCFCL